MMVKCRRSCAICHRFRGTALELHHIVPTANGGPDDLDNAIPLCFDCHSEVEHYNPNHPRGTKFRPSELKRHRDEWFAKVAASGVGLSQPNHVVIDSRIASEIHNLMTRDSSFEFLNHTSLWQSFEGRVVRPLFQLEALIDQPDYEFLDADLESLKAIFAHRLREAVTRIATLTSPNERLDDIYSIGSTLIAESLPNWDEKRMQIDEADRINSHAAETYRDLFDAVRRKLGLDLRF